MEGNKVYTNTRFPNSYIFKTDRQGVNALRYPGETFTFYDGYFNTNANSNPVADPKANCYADLGDPQSGQLAMESCDESFSLLLGSSTSFGTLQAIVKNFDKFGLAGSCCRKFLLTMNICNPVTSSSHLLSTSSHS